MSNNSPRPPPLKLRPCGGIIIIIIIRHPSVRAAVTRWCIVLCGINSSHNVMTFDPFYSFTSCVTNAVFLAVQSFQVGEMGAVTFRGHSRSSTTSPLDRIYDFRSVVTSNLACVYSLFISFSREEMTKIG